VLQRGLDLTTREQSHHPNLYGCLPRLPLHPRRLDDIRLALGISLHAQTTPAAADTDAAAPLMLSPFDVAASKGYIATNSASVTRTDIATNEVPFSVNVITSELLSDTGVDSIEDTTRYAAVANNTSSGNMGQGRVNTRGYTTNDIKRNGFVLRAAAKLNPPYTDRIEIVKGPASVLYGIGRPGGSVNVITKQPLSQNSAAIKTTVGSLGLFSVDVDVGGPDCRRKTPHPPRARLQRKDSFADNVSTRLNSSEAESAGWPLRILRFPSTSTTSKQRGAKFLTPPCTRLRLVFATSSPICLAILPFTLIAVVSLPKRRKPPSGLRLSSNLAAVGCIVPRSKA